MITEILDGWLIDLTEIRDKQFPIDSSMDDSFIYELEDGREVCVVIHFAHYEYGTDAEKAENLLGELEALGKLTLEKETIYSESNIGGKAIFYYIVDNENNRGYWILDGVKVKGSQYIFSTLLFPREEYKDWAIATWHSIMKLEEN